jgi:hypothetical protein
MLISELRSRVRSDLMGWAWDQWAQLGVSAPSGRADPWRPILRRFCCSRSKSRAPTRVYLTRCWIGWSSTSDWSASSECGTCAGMTSIAHLLRLPWRGPRNRVGRRGQLSARKRQVSPGRTEPLFREGSVIADRTDETFRAHGWLKPPTKRSGKSRPPNTLAPINLAFRLRQILGISARAESRSISVDHRWIAGDGPVVTDSAGYAKRNVHEALTVLHDAGTVEAVRVGNEQRYEIDRARWAVLLGRLPEALPVHRDWPQLLAALRRLSRWLDDPAHDSKSECMLASDARVLAEQIAPDPRYAHVRVARPAGTGIDYWRDFVALVDAALGALDWPPVSNGTSNERLRTSRTPIDAASA